MKYWKRYIAMKIGEREYKAPLTMTFQSYFNISGKYETTANIFNPSEETIANVAPASSLQNITIEAGYEKDHGVCILGEIYDYSVLSQDSETVLSLKIGDATTNWATKLINKTWAKNSKASQMVEDIANALGLNKGKIQVGEDIAYSRETSFITEARKALKQMALETNSHFFVRNGRLYFQPKTDQGIQTGIQLSASSGLLDKPEKINIENNESWKIKSLFNYKIGAGENIEVQSATFSGTAKVIRGFHNYDIKEGYTEIEVMPL